MTCLSLEELRKTILQLLAENNAELHGYEGPMSRKYGPKLAVVLVKSDIVGWFTNLYDMEEEHGNEIKVEE